MEEKIKSFRKLLRAATENWREEILNKARDNGVIDLEFEVSAGGESFKIDILSPLLGHDFRYVEPATENLLLHLKEIMRQVEEKVRNGGNDAVPKAKKLLESLPQVTTETLVEIKAGKRMVGVIWDNREKKQFYLRWPDNFRLLSLKEWPYELNWQADKESIDLVLKKLPELRDAVLNPTNRISADDKRFEEARKRIAGNFIQSKKVCESRVIKGTEVKFGGSNLMIMNMPLLPNRWTMLVPDKPLLLRRFVIDNEAAIVEYIKDCRRRKKPEKKVKSTKTSQDFFNPGGSIVKKARKLINDCDRLLFNIPTLGVEIPKELHVHVSGVEITIRNTYPRPEIQVDGKGIEWPYNSPDGEAWKISPNTKLLSSLWEEASPLLQERLDTTFRDVEERNKAVMEKLKEDLAPELLHARFVG